MQLRTTNLATFFPPPNPVCFIYINIYIFLKYIFCLPGSCSSECQSKRSHTDEDDDEDEPDGAAVRAAEERPSRPEKSAEVQ